MGYKRAGYKIGGLVCGKVDREKGKCGQTKIVFSIKSFCIHDQ